MLHKPGLHRDFIMQLDCIVNSLIRPVGECKALFILTGSNNMGSLEIKKNKIDQRDFYFYFHFGKNRVNAPENQKKKK